MSKPPGTIHRKFSDEEIRQIEVMAGLGMPLEQISAVFDIAKSTLENRIKDDDRINRAIRKGRAIASSKVRQTAFQMAVSGDSAAMTIFWLKVRERWKEPRPVESGSEIVSDAPIKMSYVQGQRIEKPVKQIAQPTAAKATTAKVIIDGKKGRKEDGPGE